MRRFFHRDTDRFRKVRNYVICIALLPLLMGSVICTIILLVNVRGFIFTGFAEVLVGGICGAILVGILVAFIAFYSSERLVARHARYSYIEIGEQQVVVSQYKGNFTAFGQQRIYRRLYVIDLALYETANHVNKKIEIHTKPDGIRIYETESNLLGYYFVGGKLFFDHWWYNECGFSTCDTLFVKPLYIYSEQLLDVLVEAKSRCDSIPPPKPYVHKELDFVKRRKALERLKRSDW